MLPIGNKLESLTGTFKTGKYISDESLKEINILRDTLYTTYFDFGAAMKDCKSLVQDDSEK